MINDNQFSPSQELADGEFFKRGDTILLQNQMQPILQKSWAINSSLNNVYKVNSGSADDNSMVGKLLSINGYSYPNRLIDVFTGETSFATLPHRCSDVNV